MMLGQDLTPGVKKIKKTFGSFKVLWNNTVRINSIDLNTENSGFYKN